MNIPSGPCLLPLEEELGARLIHLLRVAPDVPFLRAKILPRPKFFWYTTYSGAKVRSILAERFSYVTVQKS